MDSASKIPRRNRIDPLSSPLTPGMLTASSLTSPSVLNTGRRDDWSRKDEVNQEMLSICSERLKEVIKRHEKELVDLRSFSNYERESFEHLLEEQRSATAAEIMKAKELELRLASLEAEIANLNKLKDQKVSLRFLYTLLLWISKHECYCRANRAFDSSMTKLVGQG
jgi:hypothetical protein